MHVDIHFYRAAYLQNALVRIVYTSIINILIGC